MAREAARRGAVTPAAALRALKGALEQGNLNLASWIVSELPLPADATEAVMSSMLPPWRSGWDVTWNRGVARWVQGHLDLADFHPLGIAHLRQLATDDVSAKIDLLLAYLERPDFDPAVADWYIATFAPPSGGAKKAGMAPCSETLHTSPEMTGG
jgi:hypothetical protein